MGKLIFFGSSCIDYYVNLNGGTAFAGGGPVNMAVRAAELGASAAYVGAVGSDAYGEMIISELKKHHVDITRLRIVEGKTAFCEVENTGTERVLGDYDEGILNDFELTDDDYQFMKEGDICAMDLWGSQEGAFPKLKALGVKTAFDCADRPLDPVSRAVAPYADYVFLSAQKDSEDLRKQMHDFFIGGSSVVTATLGKEGSLSYDEDGFHYCHASEADSVLDTMGAGDSYIAGFLCCAAAKGTVEECMKKGSQAASEVLGFYGAFRQEAE